LTIEERINSYELEFAKWQDSVPHLSESGEKFYGIWVLGNDYKNKSPIKLYGSFPPNLLKRIMAFFPDKKSICHAFSGSLPKGDYIRIDINKSLNPDIVGNIEELNIKETFDLVIVDPPYSREDSLRYGFPYPNKKKCFNNLVDSLVKTGHLVWLDTMMPMYSNKTVKLIGIIGIIRSTNHKFRCLSFFEKI